MAKKKTKPVETTGMTRSEKDKMLIERYGNAFVSPPLAKQGGRPKGSKNKKTSDPATITSEKMLGKDAD